MARPFVAPDPKDRSVNEPTCVIGSAQVLGYYKQETNDPKERVMDSVKDWYSADMKKNGWSKATFHGNQCLLEVTVSIS